jgi:hypothetical protein
MNIADFDRQTRLALLKSRYRCWKQAQFLQDLRDWRGFIAERLASSHSCARYMRPKICTDTDYIIEGGL